MEQNNSETVKIFWTGGWDSTFRVLQLVLLEKRKVQPYYIVDPARKSTDAEIKAMDKIKDQLFLKHPYTKELLLTTIVGDLSNIKANQEVTDAYLRILKQQPLGCQNDFLARYCLQEDMEHMEMSVEDSPVGLFHILIQSHSIKVNEGNYTNYEIDSKYTGTDVHTLFKYFRYPILFITKLDMQKIAIKEGFEDLMDLTWFCHNPQKYGTDYEGCGVCVPCIEVMSAGMENRMSLRSKIRYYFRIHLRIEKLSRIYPNLFAFFLLWKRKLLK